MLITDGGPELAADATCAYLTKNGIQHTFSSPYHPQSNGRVERLNGVLVEALSKLSATQPERWAEMLPTALLVCRTRTNCNIGKSPYELVYGEKPHISTSTIGPRLQIPRHVPQATEPNVLEARKDQEHLETRRRQQEAIPLTKERFQIGDEVWVMNHDKTKLQPKKKGPGIIMEVKPNNNYLVKGIGARAGYKLMHHDRLRLCHARIRQRESRLPVSIEQLNKYQARTPDNLRTIPKTPGTTIPGGDVATLTSPTSRT